MLLAALLAVLDEAAPGFTLKDLAGKDVALASFKDRKAVVLVFTGIECPRGRAAVQLGRDPRHDVVVLRDGQDRRRVVDRQHGRPREPGLDLRRAGAHERERDEHCSESLHRSIVRALSTRERELCSVAHRIPGKSSETGWTALHIASAGGGGQCWVSVATRSATDRAARP